MCNVADTECVYTECLDEICGEFGKTFTWDIKAKQMGMKERDSAQLCIGKLLRIHLDMFTHVD